jgi:hypothetical protein
MTIVCSKIFLFIYDRLLNVFVYVEYVNRVKNHDLTGLEGPILEHCPQTEL